MADSKNRLNIYGENIRKGARKADLVALLILIETNLLKGFFPLIYITEKKLPFFLIEG